MRNDVKIKDLIYKILKLTKSKSKLYLGPQERPTEIYEMRAKNTLAKKYLKWKPQISFDQGLINTIEWYKKYKKFYNYYGEILD